MTPPLDDVPLTAVAADAPAVHEHETERPTGGGFGGSAAPDCDDGAHPEAANVTAALTLVEALGAKVFPVYGVRADHSCACGDAECKSAGKHPMHTGWQREASRDAAVVRAMFERVGPVANIGIRTGGGVVWLDFDGPTALADFEARFGKLPAMVTVRTARGVHKPYRTDALIRCSASKVAPGVDGRGEGGYVVGPGSVHKSGTVYAFEPGFAPADGIEIATAPEWLVALLAEPPRPVTSSAPPLRGVSASRVERWADGALTRECEAVRTEPEGSRDKRLNKASFSLGMMVAGGALDAEVARRELHAAAIEVGLGERETLKTIRSGMTSGAKKDARSGPTRDAPGFVPVNGVHGRALGGGGGAGGDPFEPPDEPTVAPLSATEEPAAAHRLEVLPTTSIFAPLPPHRWAVAGLQVGPGRAAMIAGYGASAKTLSAQALAVAVTSGRPIWNRFECSPMVVLHVDYEQSFYATAKRYQRLALGMNVELADLGNRLRLIAMPEMYATDRGAYDEYARVCEGVDLVIVDSFRAMTLGADENDSKVRQYIDLWSRVSGATGTAPIIIHHADKPKKEASGDGRTTPVTSSRRACRRRHRERAHRLEHRARHDATGGTLPERAMRTARSINTTRAPPVGRSNYAPPSAARYRSKVKAYGDHESRSKRAAREATREAARTTRPRARSSRTQGRATIEKGKTVMTMSEKNFSRELREARAELDRLLGRESAATERKPVCREMDAKMGLASTAPAVKREPHQITVTALGRPKQPAIHKSVKPSAPARSPFGLHPREFNGGSVTKASADPDAMDVAMGFVRAPCAQHDSSVRSWSALN